MMLAAAILCGCAATKPVHYYTIQPLSQPAPSSASPASKDGLTLLVGEIVTPARLQDGRIRYRIGANETGAYEYHRWVDQPGFMVRNSRIRVLRASGRYRRVLDAGSSAAGDYLVRGKLNEFDEVDNASVQTKISLQIELVDRKTNLNVWDGIVEREEPVASKTVADVVQSLDRNLQGVVSESATQIGNFLATQH